jgi:hypothetical protein
MRHSKLGRRGLTAALIAVSALVIGAVFGVATNGQAAGTSKPVNTSPPTITGTTEPGEVLTANPGIWTGGNLTFTYRWLRCDATGNSCVNLAATSKTYTLRGADVGNTMRVGVTATNSDGSTSARSAQTAVVTKGAAPPSPTGCPSGTGPVNVSDVSSPASLVIDGQSVSPSPIGRNPGDLTAKIHVSACAGRSVAGALVYITAVPFNQFSIPAETPTGSDGWATMTMHQESGYPASSHQQLLAVFVRARKQGENVLGGISARRLISSPVNLRK